MATPRDTPIELGGITLKVARDQASGAPLWYVESVPGVASDAVPFREIVPLGNWGMGSSIPTGIANQCDYALDCELDQWGHLGPGPQRNTIALGLSVQPVALRTARDTSGSAYGFTSGTTSATTSAQASSESWADATNAQVNDTAEASVSKGTYDNSNYLKITSMGVTGPSGAATVTGIEVQVSARLYYTSVGRPSTMPTANIKAYIVKGGTILATSQTQAVAVSTTDSWYTLGGPAYLWGSTFTGANVTASDFGVAVRATDITLGDADTATVYVNYVRVKVYVGGSARYLYVLAGDVLKKIRMVDMPNGNAFTVASTKSFPAGVIGTDLCFMKDVRTDRSLTGSVDKVGLVAFGATNSLEQIDAIGYDNTADTYSHVAATAYATLLGLFPTQTNTERRVWRTAAQNAPTDETTGAFAGVANSTIPISGAKDYTDKTVWQPTVFYQVGDFFSDITGWARYQMGVVIGKPEGLYVFDQNGASLQVFTGPPSTDNGRVMKAWGKQLVVAGSHGLFALPAVRDEVDISLRRLRSNLSPIFGHSHALDTYGAHMFVNFYNEADSYIFKMKRTWDEQVTTQYLYYPMFKVAAHKVKNLFICDNGLEDESYYLFWDQPGTGGYDLGYMLLDPMGSRRYQTGGFLKTTRMGSPTLLTRVERLTFYGENCNTSDYWTASIAWDTDIEDDSFTTLDNIDANGRNLIDLTPGIADEGYIYQLKLTSTLSAATSRPRVRGTPLGDGQVGIMVEGVRQPRFVERIRAVFNLGDQTSSGAGGYLDGDAQTMFDAMAGLASTTSVTLRAEHHFGDLAYHPVVIESVNYQAGNQEGHLPYERRVTVAMRVVGSVVA